MLMTTMTHRQRVQAALDHREPDLVPIDFGTGGNTSPVPEVYRELAQHYAIEPSLQLVPHIMRLAVVDECILQELDIDTRPVYMAPAHQGQRPGAPPGHLYDDWGVEWQEFERDGIIYRELADCPLKDATLGDLDAYPWWPNPLDSDRYLGVRETAERLYRETDYALIGCPAFNGVWERSYYLCGFESMLISLKTDLSFVHAVLRRITDITKQSLGRYLELVEPYIEVVKMGDDLGGQAGPLMSPATYRQVIKPYHQELFQFIKEHSRARVFLHTCGSVYKLLPDLIEAGVDILNPVQVSARDMDTRRLKAEFGDRLSFWGAIDTQHVLPHGSIQDVRAEVERRIADLAPGGGYVVAPVHNVQADVPAENVIAMYRHAREIGQYPLRLKSEPVMKG